MTELTGRIVQTERGEDLVLFRSLSVSLTETWRYLTETSLTDLWFGPWEGDAQPGGTVRIRMRYEAEEPEVRAQILVCDAPQHLAVRAMHEYGSWDLELFCEADGTDDTTLRFVHHLQSDDSIADIGPGWEYYLDLLVAATEATERPSFEQYYPALCDAYRELG